MQKLILVAQNILDGKIKNTWVQSGGLRVYMRCGYHAINSEVRRCLDIANVVATPPGKGTFTSFLGEMERLVSEHHSIKYVYVECILNARLFNFLERRGYSEPHVALALIASSLYKEF